MNSNALDTGEAPPRTDDRPSTASESTLNASSNSPFPFHSLVEFRQSLIHGTGGFAREDIPEGAQVIEYVGEKISKAESLRRCQDENPFIFTVTDEFDLDGAVDWNPARFLNHSCAPNCEAQNIDDHIWIVAARDIRAGEELTFDYGYDLSEYRDQPCGCGAPNCLGFIVASEFAETVRRQNICREP